MGNRNNKTTENKPIGNGFTNQNKSYGKTLFSRQPWPGGAPKSEEANRHADIHSSSNPQSLDTSELSRDADGVNGSNVEHVASLDIDQILELQPSEVSNEDVEKILSEIVYRSRFLISLCSSLKENLARPDPIYPRCAIEANSYYDEWNQLRRGLRYHIERRLYDKCPTIEEIFFELQKLEHYLILDVPIYDKYDPTSVDHLYPDPRKAIELTLITTKYVTSLLDKISPPHIPAMTSDGYTDIESIFNSDIGHGSVNAKTDDNSNISDCVAPIEESLPLDHNSLKPNNPKMTSDDNAEIENSSNSAIEDGSVNAKTDDNSNISDCVAPIEESLPLDHNSLKPNNPKMTSDEEADLVENETTSEGQFDVDIHLKQDVLLEMNSPASNTDSLSKTLNSSTNVKHDRFVAILKVFKVLGTAMKRMDIISSAKNLANLDEFCDETWIKDFYTLKDIGCIEACIIGSTTKKGYFLLKNQYREFVKILEFNSPKKRKKHKPEK